MDLWEAITPDQHVHLGFSELLTVHSAILEQESHTRKISSCKCLLECVIAVDKCLVIWSKCHSPIQIKPPMARPPWLMFCMQTIVGGSTHVLMCSYDASGSACWTTAWAQFQQKLSHVCIPQHHEYVAMWQHGMVSMHFMTELNKKMYIFVLYILNNILQSKLKNLMYIFIHFI
jgi:hypothetical protein